MLPIINLQNIIFYKNEDKILFGIYIIRDRLVDYSIAMESMFIEYSFMHRSGPGKEKTLKHHLRENFNSLDYGSDTGLNVTDWDGFIHCFYDYRSRIVHGAKNEDHPHVEKIVKIVYNLEIICRGFLKRFLKDGILFDCGKRKIRFN